MVTLSSNVSLRCFLLINRSQKIIVVFSDNTEDSQVSSRSETAIANLTVILCYWMVSISRVRFPASLLHRCICPFVVQYKSRKFSRIAALHWSNSRIHPCCVVVICRLNPPYARFCLTPNSTQKEPRPVISPLTVRSQCAWYYRIDNVFRFL